ncbi:type VI secretion system protein TssA [Siccirubricoccus sp. KC 17139]|uniref:Type VI secretion system protein TssA n=1 Tax=Siccirubricoccus soli TaxID=2899147 RepID=A0ABT1D0T3_9PROT|nr:type VI secretion system protein TssA [Siccirubricoccus soli]MCO6415520.1 type VI secretion system protein TssA [Siccirubricoccus soli]MCP2681652.1 type VI secretion system protein TssA [Siccirubricoccus soli]
MAEFDTYLETEDTGSDLEFDADFLALNTAATGKPEQQFGDTVIPAEDPDWREVEQLAVGLLERSRDIRIIVHLAVARLHTQGVPAFAEAVGLIARLLDTHWEGVHPRLDPDDDNDPTMRANAVLGLGHVGRVVQVLREAPLARSRRAGSFGWQQIALAIGLLEQDPEATPPTEQEINAAFAETDPDYAERIRAAFDGLARDLKGINTAFEDKGGPGTSPDLSRLEKQVFDIRKVLDRFKSVTLDTAAESELQVEETGEKETEDRVAMAAAPRRAGGAGFASVLSLRQVETRQEAMHLMEVAATYFETYEPASPLPLLIRRAQRLADKNFLDLLRDMAPDGLHQAQLIAGTNE